MAHEVKGVIAGAKGEAVRLETIVVPNPGPNEALVRVKACGVCHTDLHYREGAINDDFPFLLGHEAAGTVEAVGENVTNVAPWAMLRLRVPGWRVILSLLHGGRRVEHAALVCAVGPGIVLRAKMRLSP